MTTHDLTSALVGFSMPLHELVDDIHRRGWTLTKVAIKDGQYVATVTNPHKEAIEATGRTDATAVGNALIKIMRREHMRSSAIRSKLGAWDPQPIEAQWAAIAQAYAGAPTYEPKAAVAWMNLAQDCQRRAQTIRQQLVCEYTYDPTPYQDLNELREDVTAKRHVTITRAFAHHPVWSEQQMCDYRLVVDVLGHAVGGGDWGWHGTCMAFASLAPMFSEQPQKALFTELLGQAAYGSFYRSWGPQKVCFLKDIVEKEQAKENKPGHTGVHPSQSIVPSVLPRIGRMSGKVMYHNSPVANRASIQQLGLRAEYDAGEGLTEPGVYLSDSPIVSDHEDTWQVDISGLPLERDPEQYDYAGDTALSEYADTSDYYTTEDIGPERLMLFHAAGVISSRTSTSAVDNHDALDPNDGWESGVPPLPDNAYLWQRDQNDVDPLDSQTVMDNLRGLEPGLSQMHPELGKQAVVNALRQSLLGSRNNAMGHAIHYQDVAQIPAGVDDPMAFWDALEQRREQWNTTRGYAPESHKQHWPQEQQFKQWVKAANPQLDDGDVARLAKRELLHMLTEEEQRLVAQDPGEELTAEQIEHESYNAIGKRLKSLTKPSVDQKVDFGDDHLWHEATHHADMYPPYLASRLRSIAQLGRHADELSQAARKDLLEHRGHGHHFRATALKLGIPGLGPKEASNAWLHLAPQTSQLAVINPEIAEVLGHDYATETTNRDYFKHERELTAGRDAAGYSHVPLGPFSAGLWDLRAGGPGYHSDRSALKAHAPTPWSSIDHQAQQPSMPDWPKPYWWESTQAARDGAGKDFDRTVAVEHPSDAIPFQRTSGADGRSPWVTHPVSGERLTGAPGTSLMQHLKDSFGHPGCQSVWGQDYECGKGPAGTVSKVAADAPQTSWHLTDNPQFALDPTRVPTDNTFAMQQRTQPGLYVGDPERWLNGHDYARPFVAEIAHPPIDRGRWGGESFIPAEQFPQTQVKRVIPLDEYARETYGDPGWVESALDYRDVPYHEQPRYPGYRYTGPDVREMAPEQAQQHLDRMDQYIKQERPHILDRYDENGERVAYGDPRWKQHGEDAELT